ncbi:glucosaminidase domain-containing protein [Candidatus Darwinibacter acetoxidans]
MKVKPWFFLTVSVLIVAGALAVSTVSQARQDEIAELEVEAGKQLDQLREAREQLDEAVEKVAALEDMLLNLQRMESIVTGQAAPSRGGRQMTLATMPLDTPSGYSAARFERVFAGTALAGIGEALVAAEEEIGVNGVVLAGIIIHESGWGTSRLARERNNLAGLGAYDGREYAYSMTFGSRENCIMFLARLLRDKPGTLEQVGRWYASDPRWAAKVAGCVRSIAQKSEVRE